MRSKGTWGYDEALLRGWRGDGTFTPSIKNIQGGRVQVAADDDRRLYGWYELSGNPPGGGKLSGLWIAEDAVGQGIGRELLGHARNLAGELGYTALTLHADPHAEGFYRRMGAKWIGSKSAPLPSEPNRELPVVEE